MKSKALRYVILLAVISVAGVFLIQFGFLKSTYSFSEKKFSESATVALKEVAWQILNATGNAAGFDSLASVEVITSNYYVVKLHTEIEKKLLKEYLIEELKKHEIYSDFEFAIYNRKLNKMDNGILVSNGDEFPTDYKFATNNKFSSYFAVHFPNRVTFFTSQLSVWYFLTALLMIVVLYFGYTLTVILRQRRLSEVQKSFINNLTHELKTPISSIALSASVINDPEIIKTPERLFRYAKIIEEQNQRLSKNVEKVLNLASIEKSRIRLNLEQLDLLAFLNEVIDHFRPTDFGRKAKIRTVIIVENIKILADRFHLQNLVLNILENGVKYCEKNPELTITINLSRSKAVIEFADNGIGIPKKQRRKIFKKFYRVPTGNVHNVKGFGLGLDYVQKIVSAHKWKIKVDENQEGGSIFKLKIPAQK